RGAQVLQERSGRRIAARAVLRGLAGVQEVVEEHAELDEVLVRVVAVGLDRLAQEALERDERARLLHALELARAVAPVPEQCEVARQALVDPRLALRAETLLEELVHGAVRDPDAELRRVVVVV